MDNSIEEDDIVSLVQFMVNNDINDSLDMDSEKWDSFMSENNLDQSDARDLMENFDDSINIPDLMDYLKRFGGKIILTGGGINECLKEVEIAFQALNKPYDVLTQYLY